VRVGALCSVPRGRSVHQHRIDLLQSVVADIQAFGHTLAEVLNEDVRLLNQFVNDLNAFARLEVEGYATLVPIVCLEVCVAVAG